MAVIVSRPRPGDHAPYYARYVERVPDGNVVDLLEQQGRETIALLRRVDDARSRHRYAPDKWSVRQVVGHLSDTERVFAYRALTFARGDTAALPGMDQDAWVPASNADERAIADLVAEFSAVRAASVALLRGFGPAEFARAGTASNNHVTVGALAYIMAGHELHHVGILREQYGLK